LGNACLDKLQAMVLLKELIAKSLVDPSYVNISIRKPDHDQIQIRSDSNKEEIEKHASKNGLTIE